MYERMLAAGAQPTATTYTALISAYGKNGQLDKALQIFQDMVRHGPAGLQRIGMQDGTLLHTACLLSSSHHWAAAHYMHAPSFSFMLALT